MFLKQLWTSFNHSWVDSETSRDSELVEHELVDEENHQTVEAPRIVLTMAKAKVTTSPSPDWDMDPCKPAVAPTMKATQGSYHNHCSFCLFNLKNEGFCITEDTTIPPVVSDKLWNNDLMIILLLDLVCIWMKWFITVDLFSLLPLYLMTGHYRATVTQILLNYFADVSH